MLLFKHIKDSLTNNHKESGNRLDKIEEQIKVALNRNTSTAFIVAAILLVVFLISVALFFQFIYNFYKCL